MKDKDERGGGNAVVGEEIGEEEVKSSSFCLLIFITQATYHRKFAGDKPKTMIEVNKENKTIIRQYCSAFHAALPILPFRWSDLTSKDKFVRLFRLFFGDNFDMALFESKVRGGKQSSRAPLQPIQRNVPTNESGNMKDVMEL